MIGTRVDELSIVEPALLTEPLTPRELEILSYLSERFSNQEIASRLTLTLSTVKWYIRQIFQKLGVNNRRQAVMLARELGIIREDILLRAPQHNLPHFLMPLVGREVELERVIQILQEPQCRFLTLIGPGGIGKTKLAIQVGHELVNQRSSCFSDGVYFIDHAPLSDSAAMIAAMARHLNCSYHDKGEELRARLFNYLRPKKILLILDNFEHLIGKAGADLLLDLLTKAPDIKILVTSRLALNILGEQLLSLEGLEIPKANLEIAGESIVDLAGNYSSVQLFQLCARRINPDFTLEAHSAQPVMRICQLTGGLPLAIELAASLISVLEPGEIVAEIVRNSDILVSDSYDLPHRQRSMRSIFDTSWDLLEPQEKIAVQWLSIFRAGFTREAVQGALDMPLTTLLSCVKKGWIQPQEGHRFKFHELLRQYARENLQSDLPLWQAGHDRHSAYYCRFAGERESEWHNSRQLEVHAEFQTDYQNIILAWEWSLDHGYIDQLRQAIESLYQYFEWTGQYREGRSLFAAALHRLARTTGMEEPGFASIQQVQLMLITRQAMLIEESEAANLLYRQALDICCRLDRSGVDIRHEKALTLFGMGKEQIFTNPQKARKVLTKALELFERNGDLAGMGNTLWYLGADCWINNQYGPALDFTRQGQVIAQRMGDRKGIGDSLDLQAKILRTTGHLIEAEACGRESLAEAVAMGLERAAAIFRVNLAHTFLWAGKFSEAQLYAEESLDDFAKLHDENTYAMVLIARALLHQRQYVLARYYAGQALELDRGSNDALVAHRALWTLAECALVENDLLDAQERFSECAAISRINKQDQSYCIDLANLSLCATLAGQPAEAGELLTRCLENTARLRMFMPAIQSVPAIAYLAHFQGDHTTAIEALQIANGYPYLANSLWFQEVLWGRLKPGIVGDASKFVVERQALPTTLALWNFIDRWMAARKS